MDPPKPPVAPVLTPEEQIDAAAKAIDGALRPELLQRILASDPPFFERVIVDLLVAMGHGGSREDAGQVLGDTGDGGIDGVIHQDPLGLDVVCVQAKRHQPDHSVAEDRVREFSGSLLGRGATKGVFVTTSRFTEPARGFASSLRQQKVVLIDGDELTALLVKHGIGVRTDRTVEIKKPDLDYFEESESGEVAPA